MDTTSHTTTDTTTVNLDTGVSTRGRKKLTQRDISKAKKADKKRSKNNYLNNADMLAELKVCHEQGKLTESMGRMFLALVTRYATIPRFANYSYNDDMRGFALLTLAKVWKNFDANRFNNPFAYFTQIVHHAFHQLDNQERRQRDIRDVVLVNQGKNPSFNFADRYKENDNIDDFGDSDYMEFIDKDVKIDDEIVEIVADIQEAQEREAQAAAYGNDDDSSETEVKELNGNGFE